MASKLKRFPINMVLLGPPGVGKGVYCSMFEKDLKLKTFSTGEFSRVLLQSKQDPEHSIFTKEELKEIEARVKRGELLSDDTVNKIVMPQIKEAQKNGMIFDGYPRTLKQAEFLNSHLRIDIAFNLTLRHDILVRKLLGRRVCPQCKKSFNVENVNEGEYVMPPMLPKHGDPCTCDTCTLPNGSRVNLITRHDDTREVIERR